MAHVLAFARRLFPALLIKRKLLGFMVLLSIYGWAVYELVELEHLPHIEWGAESTVLNGLVLGFLLSFRNNHAYDRWWEARKLWGQLVNDSRNLCLKVGSLAELGAADRHEIAASVIDFARALERHLRSKSPADERAPAPAALKERVHEPSQIVARIYASLHRWRQSGVLDGFARLWIDPHVKSLVDICGACERIRYTPLSSSYRALLRHGIALYVLVSPFYLIEDIGPSSFPLFVLAAYFLIGIEMVAEEIEEPFRVTGDNLPLEHYCAKIEASVREILPPPVDARLLDA
jgi:ion channel-forming bestrophin family protein